MLCRSLSRRPRVPTSKNFPREVCFSSQTCPKKTKVNPIPELGWLRCIINIELRVQRHVVFVTFHLATPRVKSCPSLWVCRYLGRVSNYFIPNPNVLLWTLFLEQVFQCPPAPQASPPRGNPALWGKQAGTQQFRGCLCWLILTVRTTLVSSGSFNSFQI